MTLKSVKDRINLARRAIRNLRSQHGRDHERGIVFGAIGLLDFVESGDSSQIVHQDIRHEIKKILLQENRR